MARLIFIVGPSGSGKSASLRNLDPKSSFIINSDDKDLPEQKLHKAFNEKAENYFVTSSPIAVLEILDALDKRSNVKTIVLDTWSRTMTDGIMKPKFRKEDGWEKWGNFAAAHYDLFVRVKAMRNDINVYFLAHPESIYDDRGLLRERIAVQGQQLAKIGPESFSSIVLYTEVIQGIGDKIDFCFRTITKGPDTCKTPIGMFKEILIPNDLKIVNDIINNYYA